jgi:hypothetical protein
VGTQKSISTLEIAAWRLCSLIALGIGYVALEPFAWKPVLVEWKLLLVNGLLFAQPVVFFVITIPRAIKIIGSLILCVTLYMVYPDVLSAIGNGERMSGHAMKGSWVFYWIFLAVCGLVNAIFLGTSLLGRLLR